MPSYDGYVDYDEVEKHFADFTKRIDASVLRMKGDRLDGKEGIR